MNHDVIGPFQIQNKFEIRSNHADHSSDEFAEFLEEAGARLFLLLPGEFLQELPLLLRDLLGDMDHHLDELVPPPVRVQAGHSLTLEPEDRVGLGAGRDLQAPRSCHGGDLDLPSQDSGSKIDGGLAVKVAPAPLEDGMGRNMHNHVEIPGGPTPLSCLALSTDTEVLPVIDPLRDGHLYLRHLPQLPPS